MFVYGSLYKHDRSLLRKAKNIYPFTLRSHTKSETLFSGRSAGILPNQVTVANTVTNVLCMCRKYHDTSGEIPERRFEIKQNLPCLKIPVLTP